MEEGGRPRGAASSPFEGRGVEEPGGTCVFLEGVRSAGEERNIEKGDKRGSERLALPELPELPELQTPEEDSRGQRSSLTVWAAAATREDGGMLGAHWQRCMKKAEEVTGNF